MHNHEAAEIIRSDGGQAPWIDVAYSYNWTFEDTIREGTWNLFFSDQTAFAEGRLNSVLWTMRPELIGSFIVFGFLAMFGRHASSAAIAFGIAALLALAGFTMLALFPVGVCIALVRTQSPGYSLSITMAAILIVVGLALGGLYDYTGESKFRLPVVHTVVNSADAAPCLGAVFVVLGLIFTPAFCTALELHSTRAPGIHVGRVLALCDRAR